MDLDNSLSEDSLAGISALWLVGCGNMGGALLSRWLESGLAPDAVTVITHRPDALRERFPVRAVETVAEAMEIAPAPQQVVLGVKPQGVVQVAEELRTALTHGPLLVSMLAGVRTGTLAHLFPTSRIVRIMPNTPVRIGRGVTAVYGSVDPADVAVVDALTAATGFGFWLDDEGRFDTVTALSGSGPAFLYQFVEALAGAGESAGLDAELASRLALETVLGASLLASETGTSPSVLRQQVTSPNGVTQAGLDVLDGDGALSSLMRTTIRAATERSRALASAADAAVEPLVTLSR